MNAGRKRHDPATIRLLSGHLTEADLASMQGIIAEQERRGKLLVAFLNAKIPSYATFTWRGTEFTAYQKEISLRVTYGSSGKYAVPNIATDDMLGAGLLGEWANSLGISIPDELRDPAKALAQKSFELNLGSELEGPPQTYRTSGTPNGRISETLWVILPDGSQVHPVCVTVSGGGQQHEFAAVPKTALVISWGFAGGSYYTQEWWNTIQAPPALSPPQKAKLTELEAKCHNSFYGTGCSWQATAGRVQVEMEHRFLEGEAQEIYRGMFVGKYDTFYCNTDEYRIEWDGITCKVFPERRRGAVVAPTHKLQTQAEAPVAAEGKFSLHSRKTFKCETCAEAGRQGFASVDNSTWKQFNDEGAAVTVQCANEQCRISGTVQK